MPESLVQGLLKAEIISNFDRRKNSEPPPDFRQGFSEAFNSAVFMQIGDIPPVVPIRTTVIEGPVGVLPSPAKRIVAADILRGQAVTPLKIAEETHQTGVPERPLEEVQIHVIGEINPTTAASTAEQNRFIATLLCLKDIVGGRGVLLGPQEEGQLPIRIKKISTFYHQIQRGVVGQYSVEKLDLKSPHDIEKALEIFGRGLDQVMHFQPGVSPSDDEIAHGMIDPKIMAEVSAVNSKLRLSVPVAIAPKEYSAPGLSEKSTVRFLRNFRDHRPFILVEENRQEPRLVRFDWRWGEVVDAV